ALPDARPPPPSTLFPYTTLFRSGEPRPADAARRHSARPGPRGDRLPEQRPRRPARARGDLPLRPADALGGDGAVGSRDAPGARRSDEHTSELQSRVDIVRRLPLE